MDGASIIIVKIRAGIIYNFLISILIIILSWYFGIVDLFNSSLSWLSVEFKFWKLDNTFIWWFYKPGTFVNKYKMKFLAFPLCIFSDNGVKMQTMTSVQLNSHKSASKMF